MPTLYTINVTNNSPSSQDFFFFQKPAVYSGGQVVYSNSIYSQTLQPYALSGAVLTFNFLQQYYAGVQSQVNPPIVGQASGYTTASQPVDLTTGNTPNNNSTAMTIPLGLTPPSYTQGVQPGAYRIVTPQFNPVTNKFNAGLAVKNLQTGSIVLSNFINAEPNKNIDCQPVLIFYVQTGGYQSGTVINFTTSSVGSATCDTTQGLTTFNVSYDVDGSWSITNAALRQPGLTQLMGLDHALSLSLINVDIKNEAGTAVISTGTAANLNSPFVVNGLSQPNAINLHSDYQVGSNGGPFRGYTCTAKNGNNATFTL
ncbi:hypothetical protein [Synechocystis sp. PCC 7509]|uniref:hypothetical protein n=1 Tax=Synechocystis sp. PCC 7509 TaxID=927677 RepID=UPI0002ACF5CF|nr:hypothetical protein [Synechocystis sp. PCC 7509]